MASITHLFDMPDNKWCTAYVSNGPDNWKVQYKNIFSIQFITENVWSMKAYTSDTTPINNYIYINKDIDFIVSMFLNEAVINLFMLMAIILIIIAN